MTDHILSVRHGDVLHLALNRPDKKNALTSAMYEAMIEAIAAADAGNGVAAIVMSGVPGIFTAGNDIGDFLQFSADLPAMPAFRFIRAIASCTTPLIAAVDGAAIGIGTTLLLHCDLAYATPASFFRMPFVELGIVPEAASSLLVPQRVGTAKATQLLLLGEGFDANEALRLGFINAIVAADALVAHALSRAQKLASQPRAALAAARRLIRGDAAKRLERIDAEGRDLAKALASPEARQIFQKFLNKSKG